MNSSKTFGDDAKCMQGSVDCWPKRREKALQIERAVLDLAAARGPGVKLPTLQELCDQFDVASGTLDRILRQIEERGVLRRKHGSGIYVTDRIRQKTVAVVFGGDIFSSGHSPFWHLLLQAVRKQAGDRPDRLFQAYLDISTARDGLGGHEQLAGDLASRTLDGLLLFTPDETNDEAGRLYATGVPLVVFGGRAPGWRVTHDSAPLIRLAARELAARGCRRIGLLGLDVLPHRPLLEAELRAAGADAQLADWSFETWSSRVSGAVTRERLGFELAQRMVAAPDGLPLPDGLVSMDDTLTRGAIAALLLAGLMPGRDVHIATGANKGSPVLDPYADDLIRIEYDPAENVRAALEMLDTLMDGGTPPANPVLIEPKLVAREKRLKVEG